MRISDWSSTCALPILDAGDLAGDLDQAPYLRVVGLPGENELPGHQAVTIRPARNDGTFKGLKHRLEGRQRLHRQAHGQAPGAQGKLTPPGPRARRSWRSPSSPPSGRT